MRELADMGAEDTYELLTTREREAQYGKGLSANPQGARRGLHFNWAIIRIGRRQPQLGKRSVHRGRWAGRATNVELSIRLGRRRAAFLPPPIEQRRWLRSH